MHPFDLHEQVQGIAFLVLDNQMQHNWTETESMRQAAGQLIWHQNYQETTERGLGSTDYVS